MLINLLNTKPSVVADGAVFFLNPEPSVFPEKTTPEIAEYLEHQCLLDKNLIEVHQGKNTQWFFRLKQEKGLEPYRKMGCELSKLTQKEKTALITIDGSPLKPEQLLAFTEGFALSGYRFLKYFRGDEKNKKI